MPPKRTRSSKSVSVVTPAPKRSTRKRVASDDEPEGPVAVPPAPKRPRRRRVVSDDDEPEAPVAQSSTAVMMTPTSAPKKKPPHNDVNDENDDEDKDMDEDEDEDPTPAAAKGKSKAKPVTAKDAFSRSFYFGMKPASDAYYNKESNLLRLRCVEHRERLAVAKAKIQHLQAKKEYLLALREHEFTLTGDALAQFRKARTNDAETALLKVQNELKALETSKVKYEWDIAQMRAELEKRTNQVQEAEASVEDTERMAAINDLRSLVIG